jgi:hypothetical protein
MNPPLLATLKDLHGPLRRVPHRCMGDALAIARERRLRPRSEPGPQRVCQGHVRGCAQVSFRRHSSGVRWCKRNGPGGRNLKGPMHRRRTVGLDIPCPVALLQSRTPLLQAAKTYRALATESRATWLQAGSKIWTEPPPPKPRTGHVGGCGVGRPQEIKRFSGVPVEGVLTSYFL